jgi:predicted phage terminase large subunit-like protein
MDLAFSLKKEADYTVIIGWAVTPRCELLLLDMTRARMDAPEFPKVIKRMIEGLDLAYLGIEKMLGASMVAHGVRMDGFSIRMLPADTDKVTRALPAAVRFEAGQVYIPLHHPERETIEHELLTFPHGAHDDIVDCFSYAAVDVQRYGGPAKPQEEIDAEREADKIAGLASREEIERLARNDPFDDRLFGGYSGGD